MARSEARLLNSIWDDDDFVARSPGAQRMFMFLISQTDLAHDGVIALRERRWARKAAGQTVEDVNKALTELAGAGFVVIDEDHEELLVRSFIRRDKVYRQPNVLRAAADHLPLVASPTIRAALATELRRVATAEDIGEASAGLVATMLEQLENPTGKGSPDPSDMRTPEPSDMPSAGVPGDSGMVTVVPQGFPVPRSSESPNPRATPPASPRARAQRDTQRGTRLPDDFTVTDAMRTWARTNAPTCGTVDHDAFVDFWRSKPGTAGRKTDWEATWRNWMRREHERRQGRASPQLVEHNGLQLRPETAARLANRSRFEAMDAADQPPPAALGAAS
jgi:hypothetical protein